MVYQRRIDERYIRRWVGDNEIEPLDKELETLAFLYCKTDDDVQAAIEILNKRDEEERHDG